jgi:hypothetical protein
MTRRRPDGGPFACNLHQPSRPWLARNGAWKRAWKKSDAYGHFCSTPGSTPAVLKITGAPGGFRAVVGRAIALACAVVLATGGCGGSAATAKPPAPAPTPAQSGSAAAPPGTRASAPAAPEVPAPARTVLVVMENHSYGDIIGNPAAPFINGLARRGALFTQSFAVTHPSEPNYLALFSGSTHGVTDDSCPHVYHAPNLASDLAAAGKSFTGYAEGLPTPAPPSAPAATTRESTFPGRTSPG